MNALFRRSGALRRAVCLLLCFAAVLPLCMGLAGARTMLDDELDEMDKQFNLIPDDLKGLDMTQPITRGEMCSIMLLAYENERLVGKQHTANQTDYFTDTDDPKICAAFELGVVNGFSDGTFRPDVPLTRAQFCKILYNFSQLLNTSFTSATDDELTRFSDGNNISETYLEPVKTMVHLGVMQGSARGELMLGETATRKQALVLFFRYFKRECEAYASQVGSLSGPDETIDQSTQAATDDMNAVVKFALGYIGSRYVYGGTTPNGFDCSGFVKYVYTSFGYKLNRVAADQYDNGVAIASDSLMPGDLVFFSNNGKQSGIYHVGIYIGDHQFVHAANTKRGVVISYLDSGYYAHYYFGARRILKG